jgi:spore coat polysaccharide biosynthesis protein SpsF
MTTAFILARMSSSRFPGKVLAPFRGAPVLAHVVGRARRVFAAEQVFVLTSDQTSDDPVAAYVPELGVRLFRGPLEDAFDRFRRGAAAAGADWAVRINADSPLLSDRVLRAVADRAVGPTDLVTTIAPRTLPRGQNPEAIRCAALWSVDEHELTEADREHVTAYYHRHPERYRIRNVSASDGNHSSVDLSVDTLDDLERLERLSDAELDRLLPQSFND